MVGVPPAIARGSAGVAAAHWCRDRIDRSTMARRERARDLWRQHMRYFGRRLLFYLVALWASITLNFAIPRLMPGNPAEAIFASHAQQLRGNPQALKTLETALGLSNDPMPVQYWHYLVDLV